MMVMVPKNAPRFLDYRRSPLPLDVALSYAVAIPTMTQTSTSKTRGVVRITDVVGTSSRDLVLSGDVRVNGIVETSCHRLVSRDDDIIEVQMMLCHDVEMIPRAEPSRCWVSVAIVKPRYYACYKPRGVICSAGRNPGIDRPDSVLISEWLEGGVFASSFPPTSSDDGGGEADAKEWMGYMKTVGRLDEESEGLLLLTDDGSFSRLLCDPEFGLEKTYRVIVRGTANDVRYISTTMSDRLLCDDEDEDDDGNRRCRRLATAESVSDMIRNGQSTAPHFTYESCRVLDVGRISTQHESDGSYYALFDLTLREGKRHAVRRIVRNATSATEGGGGGSGGTMRVCYLSRMAVEGLACGAIGPESLIEAQGMGYLPGADGERHRAGEVPGMLVNRNHDEHSMLIHRGQIVELSDTDVDGIFSLRRSKGYHLT
jgi:pseudouridine synthase